MPVVVFYHCYLDELRWQLDNQVPSEGLTWLWKISHLKKRYKKKNWKKIYCFSVNVQCCKFNELYLKKLKNYLGISTQHGLTAIMY